MMTQTQLYPVEETHSVLGKLLSLKNELKNKHLTDFFAEEDERFQKNSVNLDTIIFDFSKHRVNQAVLDHLVEWANAQELKPWIKRLFSSEAINYTEQRAAMH